MIDKKNEEDVLLLVARFHHQYEIFGRTATRIFKDDVMWKPITITKMTASSGIRTSSITLHLKKPFEGQEHLWFNGSIKWLSNSFISLFQFISGPYDSHAIRPKKESEKNRRNCVTWHVHRWYFFFFVNDAIRSGRENDGLESDRMFRLDFRTNWQRSLAWVTGWSIKMSSSFMRENFYEVVSAVRDTTIQTISRLTATKLPHHQHEIESRFFPTAEKMKTTTEGNQRKRVAGTTREDNGHLMSKLRVPSRQMRLHSIQSAKLFVNLNLQRGGKRNEASEGGPLNSNNKEEEEPRHWHAYDVIKCA